MIFAADPGRRLKPGDQDRLGTLRAPASFLALAFALAAPFQDEADRIALFFLRQPIGGPDQIHLIIAFSTAFSATFAAEARALTELAALRRCGMRQGLFSRSPLPRRQVEGCPARLNIHALDDGRERPFGAAGRVARPG
jgi:hypothetical protein